ncbi:type VII secretion protein EccB [Mycobacterium sp. ITM-2016-00317]|uniref:type VII secretion protein EccB n=1 Tax=Mycobacterium sp. ITM-2016-00317 TaxID=2099694 RepID=UPI00287F8060|nr:type VII secretion protein EccB [Mycobacterium sp. ITM-2016-00317]WNG88753.1 type VII secretion protein EccB [Mycobacterium sp. ITM-2016-00317]
MAQPTTRLQVSGHRFLARRMEHALVRGDPRLLDDPLRAQSVSLVSGAVLAVLAVAVSAILAVVRPGGALGDAPLVVVRESGAMYVRIDDVLHPVFNLASARLILGAAAEPRLVSQRAVDAATLGPQVGIPGAPYRISPPLEAGDAGWTVCDDAQSGTSVAVGPSAVALEPGASVLVTPRGESAALTYLLHGGWRSRVDLRHPAVVRALRLDRIVPQQVSAALLAAVPEAPAIEPPRIPALGTAGPPPLRDHPVGTVVRVRGTGGATDHYVVLPDGLQRIGEVAADLIRYTDRRVGEDLPTVPADVVGTLPVVDTLPVATFPLTGGVTDAAVVCAHWDGTARAGSHTTVLTAEVAAPLPHPVALAQADADGPAVDTVSVPAGRTAFVRSVSLTGSGHSTGSLFLVTDAGVLFGIRDQETARALGISAPAAPAPWPVLATLPRGPELSGQAASVVRDGTP